MTMSRKEALVRLVAGMQTNPELASASDEKIVKAALSLLAEIEKVSGSPLDDALAAAGLDDTEKLTPWIKSMRIGRAKIEAAERERCAKVAEGFGVLPSVAAAIREGK